MSRAIGGILQENGFRFLKLSMYLHVSAQSAYTGIGLMGVCTACILYTTLYSNTCGCLFGLEFVVYCPYACTPVT